MISGILVDVADDLITGLERVPISDHRNRFGCVRRHRDVFRRRLHQRSKILMEPFGNMLIAGVLKQHPTSHSHLPLEEVSGSIRGRFVQVRHAAVSQKIDGLLDWKVVGIELNCHRNA